MPRVKLVGRYYRSTKREEAAYLYWAQLPDDARKYAPVADRFRVCLQTVKRWGALRKWRDRLVDSGVPEEGGTMPTTQPRDPDWIRRQTTRGLGRNRMLQQAFKERAALDVRRAQINAFIGELSPGPNGAAAPAEVVKRAAEAPRRYKLRAPYKLRGTAAQRSAIARKGGLAAAKARKKKARRKSGKR